MVSLTDGISIGGSTCYGRKWNFVALHLHRRKFRSKVHRTGATYLTARCGKHRHANRQKGRLWLARGTTDNESYTEKGILIEMSHFVHNNFGL